LLESNLPTRQNLQTQRIDSAKTPTPQRFQ
jgi:hypothetical protein